MKTTGQTVARQPYLRKLASCAVASAIASVACLAETPAPTPLEPAFQSFPPALKSKITHVIIIYPENRSFDSLYGSFPGANGLANANSNTNNTGLPVLPPYANNNSTQFGRNNNTPLVNLPKPNLNGVNLLNLPTAASSVDFRFPATLPNVPYDVSPYVPDNYVIGDMTHKFYLEQYQINNPAYTWYANDPKNAGGPPMSKYSVWGSNPGLSLHHYDEQNAGEGAVAKQFVLADNTFHSAFGGSFANHQFLISARLPVWIAHPTEGGQPTSHNTSITPEDPASPVGQWWPGAASADIGYGYGPYLSDNTISPDPTLPGFPYSNTNQFLNPGDYWALNTVYPLRGPAGGYAVPATAPYYDVPQGITGVTPTVTLTGSSGGVNTFSTATVDAPVSWTAVNSRLPLQYFDTIGDRLNSANVSWAWFSGGWDNAKLGVADFLFQFHHQPFAYFAKYALAQSPIYPINGSTNSPTPGVDSTDPNGKPFGYGIGSANHLADEDADFYRMLDAGTLPQVSFVKPIGEDNSHPGYASVKRGQSWVGNIVARIKNSPIWPNTVIFICYDEHGGQWDHVVPPVIDRYGPGTRIPFIIASPWSKKGYVDHNQYETVSMLAFIEDLFGLPPLNTRDANALPPVAAFIGEPDLFLEATAGVPVSFQIPAYNKPISYSWSGGSSDGLSLAASTGLVTGTPTSTGKYQLTVTVRGSTAGLPPGQQNVITYVLEIDVKAPSSLPPV